jgi:hypothetical protein
VRMCLNECVSSVYACGVSLFLDLCVRIRVSVFACVYVCVSASVPV